MAGAIAEVVIGKLCEMVIQEATQEATLVMNFTRDFHWLKKKLTAISDSLRYADAQSVQDKPVKRWLEGVRDIAWDAEDVVEECAVQRLYGNATPFCFWSCDQLLFRRRMGKRIKDVKKRIQSITEDGKQLRLLRDLVLSSHSEQPSTSAPQRREWKGNSLLPTNSHPVAIEPKIEAVMALLDNSSVPVIAVVGMGGGGKTFLLRHVFERVKERYEYSIWLSISQSYSVHKLQCDLASHIGGLKDAVKDVSDERAAELIHARLRETKSLIVLDDLWRAPTEDNIITSLGLPVDNGSQCKIVVTTRNREVSQNLLALTYEMELLSTQESWQLFCDYAFEDHEQNLPPHHQLEEVAREIEEQCGRLPLALKTIGASLSKCTRLTEWKSKLHQLKESKLRRPNEVNNVNDPIMQILKLSYDSLPAPLKPCFAYLSFFPEDEEIKCEYLINLWIAEGFIPEGRDQWDIAWGYLYQFANLCLLEVWENRYLDKYCKIHDLLLDLAIDISKENRCTFSVEDAFASVERSGSWCRILWAKKEIDDKVIADSTGCCPRSLRTLSLYSNPNILHIEADLFSRMRLLRILDLSGTGISTLPKYVGKLKLLKLLNLSRTKIEVVPKCVRGLKNLSFLDFSRTWLRRLPEWISELKRVQHLNIEWCGDELKSHMPKGISELLSLRVLRSDYLKLSIEEDGLLKLEDVGKLKNLQQLRLEVEHEKELRSIEDGILGELVKMRDLTIANEIPDRQADDELQLPPFPEKMRAMLDLQKLVLHNFAVPSWVCVFTNLIRLRLEGCHCRNYPELQAMPSLIRLELSDNRSCREVPKAFGKSSGFPKLRFLIIRDFPLLEEFPDLEEGAMVGLKEFRFIRCRGVKKVPDGLEGLKRLEEFDYSETGSEEFREGMRRGEYWEKIKANNPHVRIIDREYGV